MKSLRLINLQLFAVAPSGELVSFMLGKETTFATAATVVNTQIPNKTDFNPTNATLERPGATKAVGQNDEPTGMFLGKWTTDVEPDPDNFGAWLLLTLGAEAFAPNAGNPTVPTGAVTTLSSATAVGATVLPFTLATGYIAGNGFRVDAGLPTQEDFSIVSVATNNVTVLQPAKYQHAILAPVTLAVLAYDHTFTLASPRVSFTAQINRVIETLNHFGSKVKQMQLSMGPNGILQSTFSGPYANEAFVGSPVTPTYSNINPFTFQANGNSITVNGVSGGATCMGWKASVDTGVIDQYPAYGGGRISKAFPEGKTVVTLSLDMAYEDTVQYRNFWGGQGVTGPQATVPSFPLSLIASSPDSVNALAAYKLALAFGKAKPVNAPVPTQAKDYLKQAVTFKVYMSGRGANDDIRAVLTNATNAASL